MTDHEKPQFGPMQFEFIETNNLPDDTVYLVQRGQVTGRITGIGGPYPPRVAVPDATLRPAPAPPPSSAHIPIDTLSEVARFLFVRVGLDDEETKREARRLRGILFDILQHARGI